MHESLSLSVEDIDRGMAKSTPIRRRARTDAANLPPASMPSESNSFCPPREPSERNEYSPFEIVPITDLGPSEPPDWIWPGYLARGAITLFSGIWKGGKTTLLSHLLRDMHRGGGLLAFPVDAPVLIVSEESKGLWCSRRDALELTEQVLFAQRPTFGRPDRREWSTQVDAIVRAVRHREIALVILDTLPALWPVLNENDASEVLDALTPLREISEAGAALLLGHHMRKGDGSEGAASRGSGALPGFVDIIVELRRYAPNDNADTRRTLVAYGRFEGVPPEVVIELTDDGFRVIGERADAGRMDLDTAIAGLLPSDGPGWTFSEVFEAWEDKPRPGKTRLRGALNQGADTGLWVRRGGGTKGDPHRYSGPTGAVVDSFQSLHGLGGRNESGGEG